MSPSKLAVGALALLVAATAVSAETPELCGQPLDALKRIFVAGQHVSTGGPGEACAAITAIQKGRPAGDTHKTFKERWTQATAGLELEGKEESAARELYEARWQGGRTPDRPSGPAGDEREHALDAAGFGRASKITAGMAGAFGNMRAGADAIAGGQDKAMPSRMAQGAVQEAAAQAIANPLLFASMGSGMAAQWSKAATVRPAASAPRGITASEALHAAAIAQGLRVEPEPPVKGFKNPKEPASPEVDTFHAMGNSQVAPSPSVGQRALALWGVSKTVEADKQNVRAAAGELELPADAAVGLASSQAPLGDFVNWVKNAKDSDLPPIEYGVLNQGEIGRYKRALLGGKGKITLNITIHDAEPRARAAVLFHELFHYWDKEVARLHYGNVSYGFIDRGHMPEHELDAYYLTALMWQQTKPEGAASPLAQFLQNLPQDRQAVTTFVEGNLKAIKDK